MTWDRGSGIAGCVGFVLRPGEVTGGSQLGSHGSSPEIRMD